MGVYEVIAADMQSLIARRDSALDISIPFKECTLEEMLSLLKSDKKRINGEIKRIKNEIEKCRGRVVTACTVYDPIAERRKDEK